MAETPSPQPRTVTRDEYTDPDSKSRARKRPSSRSRAEFRPWLIFAGSVLIVVVLYWAQAVLIPVALSLLLAFVLNAPATWLQRWIGRPAAVGVVVLFTLLALLVVSWTLAQQVGSLAEELPKYRQNIRTKVADIRGVSESKSLEQVQNTIEDIKEEMSKGTPQARQSRPQGQPVVVTPVQPDSTWLGLPPWTTPLFGVMGTAALVIILVSFILMEYRDLRDRVIAVIGHGYVANTTKAFDEAASRLSRYLLMQLLINVTYGALVAAGLWMIGVPYPLLWGVMGALLRFVPYVGPWMAAGVPTLLSLAVFTGWTQPLWTIALFAALELFTNLVLETLLYADAAGVSQVALLVAIAFWTWLWGPIGLLMATPLTVCVVVLGKHVPGLWFLSMLVADVPALSADSAYYQRLLAGDLAEALELVEEFLKGHSRSEAYDALLLPALTFAERDRQEGRISEEEELGVAEATRELLAQVPNLPEPSAAADAGESAPVDSGTAVSAPVPPLRVLGYPIESTGDEMALEMLAQLLGSAPVELRILSSRTLVAEMISTLESEQYNVLVLADLPPSSASKTRYIVKRLAQVRPDLKILVGRWSAAEVAPDTRTSLVVAGATHVSSTLVGTVAQLRETAPIAGTAAAAVATPLAPAQHQTVA